MPATDSSLLSTLRCPACLGGLSAVSFDGLSPPGEINAGVLLCKACMVAYPVQSGTPVMLRFNTQFHDWFAREHASHLGGDLAAYSLPAGEPRLGEEAVQETFTDEWDLTRENELSFAYTAEQLADLNRRVWLSWIEDLDPADRPKKVLNVGCGAGMETQALREVTGADEVFAIDLNFSLLTRRLEFRQMPGVSFVVASLFDLPFEHDAFDLVYSQGVIHHTFSSAEAFASIAPRVKPGGRLFVWVYGLEDHLAPGGAGRFWKRKHHAAETAFRPLITRSPRPVRNGIFKAATAVSHMRPMAGNARLGRAMHGKKWTRQNTEHALRDWLSPRYAHRHGYNEVVEWFEGNGFTIVDNQSPAAYRELFNIPLFGVGMTGERLARPE